MIYTHRIITTDRKQIPLTAEQTERLTMAMSNRDQFFQVSAKPLHIVNIPRDIARIEKIPLTEGDIPQARRLEPGKRMVDPNGKGYKAFLEAKKKLIKKMELK